MKTYTFIFFFFTLSFCLVSVAVLGQDTEEDMPLSDEVIYPTIKIGANVHFTTVVPSNNLRGNMDPGYGVGASLLAGKYGFPLKGGLQFNMHWHNEESRSVYLYNGFFDERHSISTNSYSFMLDAVIRAEAPWDFFLQPYVDAFIGFNRFATWTSIEGEEAYEDDPDLDNFDDTYREIGDWTWAYGGAIGLRINLHTPEYIEDPRIMLDLKAAYRRGGAANYLNEVEDPGLIEFPIEAFEERESTTDMMQFHIGVSFLFP